MGFSIFPPAYFGHLIPCRTCGSRQPSGSVLKRFLSILSDLILDSGVDPQIGGTQHVYVCFYLRTGHALPLVPYLARFLGPTIRRHRRFFAIHRHVSAHLALCKRTSRRAPDFARRVPRLPVRTIMSSAVSVL